MPRSVPSALVQHKKGRRQSTCFCWAIKPKYGPWEGYTSFNRPLYLPSYSPLPGDEVAPASSIVPAMRYGHRGGVSPTSIPTRLNLSQQSVDVTVLAFDPDLLDAGYYLDAEIEAFEINWRGDLSERDVIVSGRLGTVTLEGMTAKIKLIPWHDLANMPTGEECGETCSVGRCIEIAGEEFGTHRCAGTWSSNGGPTPGDGVKKPDWTSEATVIGVTDRSRFRVQWGANTISGKALYSQFAARLEAGKVEFHSEGDGGKNRLQVRSIKWASNYTQGGNAADVELHMVLPYSPQIGDRLRITAGCRGTTADCKFYGNFSGANPDNPRSANGFNFQGFDGVPTHDDAKRTG